MCIAMVAMAAMSGSVSGWYCPLYRETLVANPRIEQSFDMSYFYHNVPDKMAASGKLS